jgi:hypothetical protein
MQSTRSQQLCFSILLAVSFAMSGISAQQPYLKVYLFGFPVTFGVLVFLLGFVLFIFATFQHKWYELAVSSYRERLRALEVELNIDIYRYQEQPTLGAVTFRFDWMLYATGVVYGAIAWAYAGTVLFLSTVFLLALVFAAFIASTSRSYK